MERGDTLPERPHQRGLRRLTSILVWSVIAGAFIGPGTVTTAASAGAHHGLALVWALVFSTLACFVLQELSARITSVSGRDLGQALRQRYRGGVRGVLVLVLVLGAIVVGCAAYQAGNILGAMVGASRITGMSREVLTVAIGAGAAALLWIGSSRVIAASFSLLVAVMGITFMATAFSLGPAVGAVAKGALIPALPAGSGLLVLGLIGTTVVPYNLFLGSGLARGQALGEVRLGLAVSVLLGGAISIAVLVVGSALPGEFSFATLAAMLGDRLGSWAEWFFGCGLFAAGFSSAVSAPLAAAVTARSLLGGRDDSAWDNRSWRFRSVWAGVLVVGVGFGLADVRPIPAILVAQVLNGALLPLVAVFLLVAASDRALLGDHSSGPAHLALVAGVVAVTIVLGVSSVIRAVAAAAGAPAPSQGVLLVTAAVCAVALAVPVTRAVVAGRSSHTRSASP